MDCLRGWSSLLSLAVPTCVSVCLEWWWYEFMIMLCGLLVNPKATIASMGILIQTTSLVYVFPSSLSLGVSTRVGNELGANRPAKARISMIVSLVCAVALGLLAMLFTSLMRHQWGRFFTSDAEILELTAVALPIAGLCELGNCPQTTGCGVLRGSARPTIGANINLGSFYLNRLDVEAKRAKELTNTSSATTNNTSILPISSSKPEALTNSTIKPNLEEKFCIDDELVKSTSLETEPLISPKRTVH
ncbi:hypothetical protein GH714_003842 [Hevea brasiliensis]|uniref:Multidrug and toxic compound extrusion protein n=1 Tax=Hevea brasiliensis TaxID=3981 RepID=A0A6A6NFG9_HEVBR|nr:hypothetical protein GH714_003842 [Hevea brasiliensis]